MINPLLYKPIKKQITTRIDTDVIWWLKTMAGDKGYQTLLNQLLRQAMEQNEKTQKEG